MTELKTLKEDFEEFYNTFEYEMDTYEDELRVQHAIKHTLDKTKERAIKWVKESRRIPAAITELTFMEFHDITEEDLK